MSPYGVKWLKAKKEKKGNKRKKAIKFLKKVLGKVKEGYNYITDLEWDDFDD